MLMNLIYINNPFDKRDNAFLNDLQKQYDVEIMNFMSVRNEIDIMSTPTILLIHEGLEINEDNISCKLNNPSMDDISKALGKQYPYPENIIQEPSLEDYLLDIDFRLSSIELGL